MDNLTKIKKLLESSPVALATVTSGNKPNVIGVAYVKVVADNLILITDNYMNQTLKDLAKNKNVCLLVWNEKMQGYKLIGQAKYFKSGQWLDYLKRLKENKRLPAKGAILVKVSQIIASK